eukprot:TRINITY_DN21248_c0_g1_i1.p1 TRINITY_DN21248_c0_g1~~TRINITY_DN21248_c0_g1_i1.p1  ORF type:complete len:660 (+),score=156.64 TRINITY_DN21248_c0_g1_i1:154-2133(+)
MTVTAPFPEVGTSASGVSSASKAPRAGASGSRSRDRSADLNSEKAAAQIELEVQLSELETRVRQASIELLTPTILRTKAIEGQVAEIKEEVQKNSHLLSGLSDLATNVRNQGFQIDTFRETLARWEKEQVAKNTETSEEVSLIRQDLDGFRYTLEMGNTSIASIKRCIDRTVEELRVASTNSDALRHHMNTQLEQQRQILNDFTNDFTAKFSMLETRQNSLNDDLWDNASGLARLGRELKITDDTVSKMCEEVKNLDFAKASVRELEAMREQVGHQISEASRNTLALNVTLNGMTKDIKDNFKVATDTVATQSASMLAEVRKSCQEELVKCEALTDEVKIFMQESKQHGEELLRRVNIVDARSTEMIQKVMTEMNSKRQQARDQGSYHVADGAGFDPRVVQAANIFATREAVQVLNKNLDQMGAVLWMVVQSERAACAMTSQDDADRAKVALVGYRDSSKGSAASTRPSTRGSVVGTSSVSPPLPAVPHTARPSRSRGSNGGSFQPRADAEALGAFGCEGGEEPVISVDQRCLSCSGGQQKTVLSGFKMACLQYAPGPVYFCRKTWSRPELMDLRMKLLDQACESLKNGVDRIDPFDMKEVSLSQLRHAKAEQDRINGAGGDVSPGVASVSLPKTGAGSRAGAANTAVLPALARTPCVS